MAMTIGNLTFLTIDEKGPRRSICDPRRQRTRARHYHITVTMPEPRKIQFGPAMKKPEAAKAMKAVATTLQDEGRYVIDEEEYYRRSRLRLDPNEVAVYLCPCQDYNCVMPWREKVIDLLWRRHGLEMREGDAYLTDRLDLWEKEETPEDVAVEWLADDIVEVMEKAEAEYVINRASYSA